MSDRPQRRPPAKITPGSLRLAGIRYLQRYTPTTSAFRRVMQRRIDKALRFHGGDPDEHARTLDALVEELTSAGALDDDRWARARAEELHRRGTPVRGIRFKLAAKGVPRDLVDVALDALAETLEEVDPDRSAAWSYARRRRLGPYRRDPQARAERREKDLAAMGRAGFPWGLARSVVDGSPPEEELR